MERGADETWTVPEVYLLTQGPDGTVAVPALTLRFFADGIEVDKADGEEVWSRDWTAARGAVAHRALGLAGRG